MSVEERLEKLEKENKELKEMLVKVASVAWYAYDDTKFSRASTIVDDVVKFVKSNW